MPLETLEQGTRIQGLVLETPRRGEGEPFDADKEITKENWDRILKREDSLIMGSGRDLLSIFGLCVIWLMGII